MNRKQFEYFLNAVHYCMWLREKKFGGCIEKFMHNFFSVIKNISGRCFKRENTESQSTSQTEMNKVFYSDKNSFSIFWADHWFIFFFCCYPGILSFILAALAIKLFDSINLIAIILFIAPVELTYLFVNKAVFRNDVYLKYFKIFEKEDELWHRKWSRITTVFCIGAVVMTIASIAAMWAVWLW